MGWHWQLVSRSKEDGMWLDNENRFHHNKNWTPSTDIAYAWEVVEKIRPFHTFIEVTAYNPKTYCCMLSGKQIIVEATSAPLAICRAALLSKLEEDGN